MSTIKLYRLVNFFQFLQIRKVKQDDFLGLGQGQPWEVRGTVVLCQTCSVLCVLEQPRVGDNSQKILGVVYQSRRNTHG